jgi:hypothetical protein
MYSKPFKILQNLINTPKLIEKERKKKEEVILGILL